MPLRLRFLIRGLPIVRLPFPVTVARCPALPTRFTCLVYRPFVRMTFLVSGFAALARNASLFFWIHRCESTSSFLHVASSRTPERIVMQEQRQIAPDVAGNQKVLPDVLMTLLPKLLGKRGMREKEPDLVSRALDGMGEEPSVFVNDLCGNAADR